MERESDGWSGFASGRGFFSEAARSCAVLYSKSFETSVKGLMRDESRASDLKRRVARAHRREQSGAGARAWHATAGCNLTSWHPSNDFRRFPTRVTYARASELMLRIDAGAFCSTSSSTAPAYEKGTGDHRIFSLRRLRYARAQLDRRPRGLTVIPRMFRKHAASDVQTVKFCRAGCVTRAVRTSLSGSASSGLPFGTVAGPRVPKK